MHTSTWSTRVVTLVVIMVLALAMPQPGGTPHSQAAVPATPEPPDFETLAGAIGRAEAWYQLYGAEIVPAQPLPAQPTTAVGEEHAEDPPAPPPVVKALDRTLTPEDPAMTGTHASNLTPMVYLPLLKREEPPPPVERRALWVTRYDWTTQGTAPAPETIDAIVAQAAAAGFNTLLFQVRAAGDAYYASLLEPWAPRLSAGTVTEALGKDPGWDPLARMIEKGHAAGLEVHAYVNVYIAWAAPPAGYGEPAPPATTPPQMFDRFTYGPYHREHPGQYGLGWDWRQHDHNFVPMPITAGQYLWASPGPYQVNAYVASVVRDIVLHYAVDGVHLDLVRYKGPSYSYDPASNSAAGSTASEARDQWQRDRITALVQQVRSDVHGIRPHALVSAAVWPIYVDKWDWGANEGYSDYCQDSKGWLATGSIDAIVPMLYGSIPDDFANWQILLHDFLADSGGRPVYPGIGTHYTDFSAIAQRIEAARAAGAPGHALFSYGAINSQSYWDDLAAGPYSVPARSH